MVFGLFATVSFLEVLVRDRKLRRPLAGRVVRLLDGPLGKLWITVGAVLGLFIAGYTGVLLAVSNQPVWSDTWALGGLFLASGLAGSAALLLLLVRYRADARASAGMLELSERLFTLLELVLLVVFVLTLIPARRAGRRLRLPLDPAVAGGVRGDGARASRARSPPGSPSPLTGPWSPSRCSRR